MTGKLVYLVSDSFIVHWPELAERQDERMHETVQGNVCPMLPGILKLSTWVCCFESRRDGKAEQNVKGLASLSLYAAAPL